MRSARGGGLRSRWFWHLLACGAVVIGGAASAHVHADARSGQVVALSVVAALVLLLRHRQALPVLVGEVVLVAVSIPTHLLSPGVGLAAAVAVYAFTLQVSRRTGAMVTIGLGAAMLVALVVADPGGPEGGGVQYALLVLLAGTLGDAIRTQRAHVVALTERAERAERTREALARQRVAEDRLSVARDLHDVVAHQIAVINLHAGVASSALRTRPDDAESSLVVVRRAARTVLSEIGDLLATLRAPDAADTGADIGPVGLTQLDEVVRSFAADGLDVTVRTDGQQVELPSTVDLTALRVVQESLANAHKHGSEHRAHLLLEYRPGALRVSVTNPVDPEASTGSVVGTGQGLLGMAERVASVRGTLTRGHSGVGTWTLTVDLPLTTRPDQLTLHEEHP